MHQRHTHTGFATDILKKFSKFVAFAVGVYAFNLSIATPDTLLTRLSRPPYIPEKRTSDADLGRSKYSQACNAFWSNTRPHAGNVSFQQAGHDSQRALDFDSLFLDFDSLFVHPESNFAFCSMPKVGCTEWTQVLHKIFYNDIKYDGGPDYAVRTTSLAYSGFKGAENVFNDAQAIRAVIVRDPLERFVSAFLDKCLREDCGSRQCIFRKQRGAISLKTAVDGMLAMNPAGVANTHWRIQSHQCGLGKYVNSYNIVVKFTKDTLASDSACILELAGLSRFDYANETRSFWHASSTRGPRQGGNNEREQELLKRMFTKAAARRLMEHLREDYRTFNWTEPTWVAEATGELYETLPNCYGDIVTEKKNGKYKGPYNK